MGRKASAIFLMMAAASASLAVGFSAGAPVDRSLLRDGCVLRAVKGTAHRASGQITTSPYTGLTGEDLWYFEPHSDVNDGLSTAKAGSRFEMLPSSALEKMIADANGLAEADYVVWARVTRYRGKNFVFPYYFLRLMEPAHVEPNEPGTPDGASASPTVPEPNDAAAGTADPNELLGIPKEILQQITESRKLQKPGTVQPLSNPAPRARGADGPQTATTGRDATQSLRGAGDSMLADRTAMLTHTADGRLSFEFAALGLRADADVLQVLPCEALEQTEQDQASVPEPVRFRIAGIVARFRGRTYLLLQRAARVYSHGNFRSPIMYQ